METLRQQISESPFKGISESPLNRTYLTQAEFGFQNSERLSEFALYVTDIRNAGVVLSNGIYRIKKITTVDGQIPNYPDMFRQTGAEFTCIGAAIVKKLRIEQPAQATFRVEEYKPDEKVVIQSTSIKIAGIPLRGAILAASWEFIHDQKDIHAVLKGYAQVPKVLTLLGGLLTDREIAEEMQIVALQISRGFNKHI